MIKVREGEKRAMGDGEKRREEKRRRTMEEE